MKNLTVGKKLGLGFGITLALMVLSTLMSSLGIQRIVNQVDRYAIYSVPNAEYVRSMQVNMQSILFNMLDAIHDENSSSAKESIDLATEHALEVHASFEGYTKNQSNDDRKEKLERMSGLLQEAAAARGEITELVNKPSTANSTKALSIFHQEYKPVINEMMDILFGFSDTAANFAVEQYSNAQQASTLTWIVLVVCTLISIIFTIIIMFVIRKSILTPVHEIMDAYREIALGNMKADITYESKDELGQMAGYIRESNRMQRSLMSDITEKLDLMAQGDFKFKVTQEYPGDFQTIKNSITNMMASINHTMHTIKITAEQVSAGAEQVSGGAQALAAGSSEQASSAEELSAAIAMIAHQAEENSSNVKIASQYVNEAKDNVAAGNEHMVQLTQAMGEIDQSSNQIANITKVIEDIAFQTNILALNAAIEAARAGAAGKGFAVVADEVRNLAAKSAEAAKQTGELIQSSVIAVTKGAHLTTQTAQILQNVGEGTHKVFENFQKIEQASAEQARAIDEMKMGLEQVSAIIQTNAATAEENSATSEEMSAQAVTLREEVERFKLDEADDISYFSPVNNLPEFESPLVSAGGLGKY